MTPNLPDAVIQQIQMHTCENPDEEVCGVVLNSEQYVRLANVADDKAKHFQMPSQEYAELIASNQVSHVVHSHQEQPYPSKFDMEQQIRTGLPWIICDISQGLRPRTFMWGHRELRAPLLGREFRHGVADCYELLRDFYKVALGIEIKSFPRDFEWWFKTDEGGQPVNMLMDNVEGEFTPISERELRPFDVVFAQVGAKVVNHCGVYLGNELVLHHMYNRASRREPYGRVKKHVSHWYRYKGEVPSEIDQAVWGTG